MTPDVENLVARLRNPRHVVRRGGGTREEAAETIERLAAERDTLREAIEAELRAWAEEHEPDAMPDRPAFLSNIRAALAAFRR